MKEATLNLKIENVNEVVSNMKEAKSIVIVNCIGLTVAETMDLRKQLYVNGCSLKVVKNNILRRASKEMGYDELCDSFAGPSAIAYSPDANTAAKIIYGFAKKNEKLVVKAGVVDGKVLNTADLKVVASLPDKNGMLSMLLSVLQAPIRNLACAVKAVADKN